MGIHVRTYFCLILASVLYTLCALPVILVLVPFASRSFQGKVWRYVIVYYGICAVFFSLRMWGKTKYVDMRPDENVPGIFIANHRSGSDAYLVSFLNRDFVQVVSAWPFKLPFLGFFAKIGGYLNINALSFDEFMESACRLLKRGIGIVAFPEGTRSGNKEMKQFHSGIFKAALAAKCPIYPVCIIGNENMPDKNFYMHDGKIRMFKLPLIPYEEYKDMSAFTLKNHVRKIIQDKITQEEKE